MTGSQGRAQNTGAPEAVVEIVNDVKLGVQVQGGVKQRNQDVLPLVNRSYEYLQRPVRGELSHTTPYYGGGMALRARGAEVTFTYWQGDGVQSSAHSFQFEDGTQAFPYRTNFYSGWEVRAEYFILDWIGVGGAYRHSEFSLRSKSSFRLNGERIRPRFTLFTGSVNRSAYSLYAPLRQDWGPVRLFGRAGISLGTGKDRYLTDFALFQSPEDPSQEVLEPEQRPRTTFRQSVTLNTQFGQVGVEVPVRVATVRASVEVERLHVPDRTKTWSYDLQLEIGIPF